MAFKRAREIDGFTELGRCGRSTGDLVQTPGPERPQLRPQPRKGKITHASMAGLAEFERDPIRERVRWGSARVRS